MVSCVLKPLTTTNHVTYNRINEKLNFEQFFNFSKNLILSKINQDWYHFSHIQEVRITFSSSFRDTAYDYYLKQALPM